MLGDKKWVDWDLVREMDLWVFGKKWGEQTGGMISNVMKWIAYSVTKIFNP